MPALEVLLWFTRPSYAGGAKALYDAQLSQIVLGLRAVTADTKTHVHFLDGRRSAAKLLTRDEAWRIAANIGAFAQAERSLRAFIASRASFTALKGIWETGRQFF
jgi:hypothetical protein